MAGNYTGLKVTVVGLGRSGMAMVSWLRRRGASVSVSDSRPAYEFAGWLESERGSIERAEFGGNSAGLLAQSDLIVVSPGVPPGSAALAEAAARGIPVVGDLELALAGCPAQVLAVSGTNGKTTTTALLGHLLKTAGKECVVAGNIGVPVAEVVDSLTANHLLVLEVSSFQLDTAPSFHPSASLLLNITPDHLDRYPSMEAYAASKKRLFANQGPGDLAILNRNDQRCAGMAPNIRARVRWFDSRGHDADGAGVRDSWVVLRTGGEEVRVLPTNAISVRGGHNLENALAAALAASSTGIPAGVLAEGLRTFAGVPHRLESVGRVGEVEFINDSKGTNTDATEKALLSFPEPVVLIAGGRDKGADFAPMIPLLKERAKAVVLIGEAAEKMEKAWKGAVPIRRAASLEEAVSMGLELAKPRGTVLLSPACASFDMFRNFEHRGDMFREAVRALAGGGK